MRWWWDFELRHTGNRPGLDLKLTKLQYNGGPTSTHALLLGSPAIDRGYSTKPGSSENACLTTDQRGTPRPLDGDGDGKSRRDIGAFERRPSSPAADGEPSVE